MQKKERPETVTLENNLKELEKSPIEVLIATIEITKTNSSNI